MRRSLGKGGRQPPRSVRHKNFFVEQSCFRSAFSQFFPPRAPPSRPPEPLTKRLPPLSPCFFCLLPNDLKQQSCSRCCVDFRQSGRFAQVARFHHGASIAARTDFPFDIRFPTGSTVKNSTLTRFVFYSSQQVIARVRGRRFIHPAKHDSCCLNFICRSVVPTDISSTNAKGKTTPQSILNGKTRYLSVGQGSQTPADRSILSVCDCSRAFKLTPHHAKQRGLDKGGHPVCHRKKR